ncbi:hypothetical protein P9G84_31640 [Brevibacillus centrosporus]|jgi:hypothetical protein|uniref:hypothetical protein n=1 Tax=Brevibacillus centrosporus TaxID=54910 RepID=UPI000F0A8583|nr:hypothetical protein [Brevibacillus centrosporus]MEC2133409.1 hypothetical protein [Brevibacillus centrosporus]RNB67764.1 hypothetical protein EDM55_19085 [Brevibacillus centrosporus]GED34124.1 hypothetical protein BCE02nite_52650 [Brevibacillus centrosporus]
MIGENDNFHKTYARAHFYLYALACYNYCIDLSWQVVWLFYVVNDFLPIEDEGYYEKLLEECKYQELRFQLTLLKKFKHRKFKDDFIYGNPTTQQIRETYNHLKHRGMFHFKGLGKQRPHLMGSVNGQSFKTLTKREIDINEWKYKLVEFDISFFRYFDHLVNVLMPKEFPNAPCPTKTYA